MKSSIGKTETLATKKSKKHQRHYKIINYKNNDGKINSIEHQMFIKLQITK